MLRTWKLTLTRHNILLDTRMLCRCVSSRIQSDFPSLLTLKPILRIPTSSTKCTSYFGSCRMEISTASGLDNSLPISCRYKFSRKDLLQRARANKWFCFDARCNTRPNNILPYNLHKDFVILPCRCGKREIELAIWKNCHVLTHTPRSSESPVISPLGSDSLLCRDTIQQVSLV